MPRLAGLSLIGFVASVACAFVAPSASASLVLTTGGTSVAGEGLVSSVSGATTVDFNSSFSNPTGYFGGGVKNGSVSGQWAAPPGDTSNYFSVGPSTTSTASVTFGTSMQYFGFYGGSPDTYNSVSLYNGTTLVGAFSGADLTSLVAGAVANGDRSLGIYWNIFAGSASDYFNKVVFKSTSNAFETDNHAYVSAVPLPAAFWLFGSGIVGLVGLGRRRKGSAATA